MMGLLDKDLQRVTMTTCYMLKKLEEKFNTKEKKTRYFKNDPIPTCTDENYNI